MSKNIYRVNKKSDLDEIMKNNFYKPVCVVFISKSQYQLYNELCSTLLTVSKLYTYIMTVIIDFDNFIDNIGFFHILLLFLKVKPLEHLKIQIIL
jgi:hypothetical protein